MILRTLLCMLGSPTPPSRGNDWHYKVERTTARRLNSLITSTTLYLQVITTKQTHQWWAAQS